MRRRKFRISRRFLGKGRKRRIRSYRVSRGGIRL